MPSPATTDGRKGDLRLQCPWSNCYPHIFNGVMNPCTTTPFPEFRLLLDHIWKYHSSLLACRKCDYRFIGGKRQEEHRQELDALKRKHDIQYHQNNSQNVSEYLHIKTMSDEDDQRLRNWRHSSELTTELKYGSLCRCLFGQDIWVPVNHALHYWVPEYTINSYSAHIGKTNLRYAEQRWSAPTTGPMAGGSRQRPAPLPFFPPQHQDRLDLDERPLINEWGMQRVMPDADSGYGSKPAQEAAPKNNGYAAEASWDWSLQGVPHVASAGHLPPGPSWDLQGDLQGLGNPPSTSFQSHDVSALPANLTDDDLVDYSGYNMEQP